MSSSSSISSGLSLQSASSSEQEWNFDHVPDGPPEALVGSDGDLPLTDGEDDLGFLLEGELKSDSEDDLHPWAKPTSSDGEEEEEEVEEEEEKEEDDSSSSAGYPPAKRFRAWADSEDDDDDEEEEAPAEGWGSSDEELSGSSADGSDADDEASED
jgi:hypothetical protein